MYRGRMADFTVRMVRNLSQKEEAKLRAAGRRRDAGDREAMEPLRRVLILDVEDSRAAKALVIDMLSLSGSDAEGLQASPV
jgi:hypothetical protein